MFKREKQEIVLPICDSHRPQKWSAWQEIPKIAIVAPPIHFSGNQQLSNCTLRKVHSVGRKSYLAQSLANCLETRRTWMSGEPTLTTLLNNYNPHLHSNYLCLFPQINVAVTPYQENSLCDIWTPLKKTTSSQNAENNLT